MGLRPRNRNLSAAVALLAAALAGCHRAAENSMPAGELGSRLPDFTANDMEGRGEISSAQLRNKVVLVDFWATWCEPCKREMPGYQALIDRYGQNGFTVIGFKATMMMDTEDPVRFVKEAGVRYPIAVANPIILDKFGGLKGLPTTFVYDRDGILRQKIIGFEYTRVVESYLKPLIGTQ